jgi:hypothetical protein
MSGTKRCKLVRIAGKAEVVTASRCSRVSGASRNHGTKVGIVEQVEVLLEWLSAAWAWPLSLAGGGRTRQAWPTAKAAG